MQKNSLHVCVVLAAKIAPGNWGGVFTHTKMFIELLLKNTIRVTLLTAGVKDDSLKDSAALSYEFVPYRTVPLYDPEWGINMQTALKKIHARSPVDFVFSEGYDAFGIQHDPLLKDIPLVMFVHNFHLVHFQTNFAAVKDARSLLSYFLSTVPRLVYRITHYELPFMRSCNAIVSVSEKNALSLRSIYRLSKEKITVLHNWVDTEHFCPDKKSSEAYRRTLGVTQDTFIFLLVGSLWRPKGFHIALKVFAHYRSRFPDSLLLIAGTGGEEQQLRALAARLLPHAHEQSVRFLGVVSYTELPRLYNTADVFLMPSLLPEAHPYTLTEAMACGLPCIVSRTGGMPEVIGDCGVLVKAGDNAQLLHAMNALTDDPKMRTELATRARNKVKHCFSEHAASEQLCGLLHQWKKQQGPLHEY